MNKHRFTSSRWAYGLAGLLALTGGLLAAAVVYRWFPSLPGALEDKMGLENLTQVVVPGSADIVLAERGAYGVYHEHRSVVGGVKYSDAAPPRDLVCTLVSRSNGTEVEMVPDYVGSNAYSTMGQKRVGVLIGSITIAQPGTYGFSCRYSDGRLAPKTVVAVGPNLAWGFISVMVRALIAAGAGLAVLAASIAGAIVIAAVTAVRRRQSGVVR